MNPATAAQDDAQAEFFVLRTPLLPFDEFLAWSAGLQAPSAVGDHQRLAEALKRDRGQLICRLKELLVRPEIREAMFIASPSLEGSIETWNRDPSSKRGRKVQRTLVRYFTRMTGRATPLGTFAGWSLGTIGMQTCLRLDARKRYRRRTRLDMGLLCSAANALTRNQALRETLIYRPNSTLYPVAGRLRYVEVRTDGSSRTHDLVSVQDSAVLSSLITRAGQGATLADLRNEISEASPDEAEAFIEQLIANQILVSDLSPSLTRTDFGRQLEQHLSEDASRCLKSVRDELKSIDAMGLGTEPKRYRDLAQELKALPGSGESSTVFQVDMTKPAPNLSLSREVIEEVLRGVDLLHRLANPSRIDLLAEFRRAFTTRYGEREVPLVEALDDDLGIGLPASGTASAEVEPLLKGMAFPSADSRMVYWQAREDLLLRILGEALLSGAEEIDLEEQDLAAFQPNPFAPVPNAFAVLARLAAPSEKSLAQGKFQLFLDYVMGPSGANLLGRFCDADERLREYVEQHMRAEERHQPNAVFAEVVHLPADRIGNVLSRPTLRRWEIPYLARAGVSADHQILVTDLLVSVVEDRVVLRSRKLGCEVIPRMTNAHNFSWKSLPIYRFLCSLQSHGLSLGRNWSWSPLEDAPFLPRVVMGRLVLSLAQWFITGAEIKRVSESRGAEQFRRVYDWRIARRIPRFVCLADEDQEYPVDLENVLSVESFVDMIRSSQSAKLVEIFPPPENVCVHGPEGQFVHEMIIPFVRRPAETPHATPPPTAPPAMRQRYLPASEWLYGNLYCGSMVADEVLREVVQPLARRAMRTGLADRWFFIRYGFPEFHLRVRFHGDQAKLNAELLPALEELCSPLLTDGRVRQVQLDTYERELERYGGEEGIDLSEKLFQEDSDTALEMIDLLSGDTGADARWRLTLVGIDLLLQDLGFDLRMKQTVTQGLRIGYANELGVDQAFHHLLGGRFRKERPLLEALLDPTQELDSPLEEGVEILNRRSARLAPIVHQLKATADAGGLKRPLADLAESYVHMHVNRMLRAKHRAQELILYDFLARLYESQAARTGRAR